MSNAPCHAQCRSPSSRACGHQYSRPQASELDAGGTTAVQCWRTALPNGTWRCPTLEFHFAVGCCAWSAGIPTAWNRNRQLSSSHCGSAIRRASSSCGRSHQCYRQRVQRWRCRSWRMPPRHACRTTTSDAMQLEPNAWSSYAALAECAATAALPSSAAVPARIWPETRSPRWQ